MSRRKFICLDCGADTGKIGEFYMLKDEIWLKVAPKKGMLCIGCIEARLGRILQRSDFNDSYINDLRFWFQRSARLVARLTCR